MKAYYHARAREYDDWWLGRNLYAAKHRPGWDDDRAELESWIAGLPPARTLDVACGTGFMTRHLRGEITGLDQSDAMLEVAAGQVPDATFVQGDALDLPFEDGEFDRLFTSYFYCHLEEAERERFLDEARRVARSSSSSEARRSPARRSHAGTHASSRTGASGRSTSGSSSPQTSQPSSTAASSTRTGTS